MATTATKVNSEMTSGPAVLRPVEASVAVCGECVFHMPHATMPGGWCACDAAELRWKPVSAGRAACGDFAIWPEGSPVPAFLAAMGF
jgi:hypothetical protein